MVICASICLHVLIRNLGWDMVRVLIFGGVEDDGDGKELFGLVGGKVCRIDKEYEDEDDGKKDSDDGSDAVERDDDEESEEEEEFINSTTEIKTEEHPSIPLNVANAGMDLILLLSLSLLLYTKSKQNSSTFLNPSIYPLLLILIFLFICIFPLQTSRKPFWLIVFRTIEAPFVSVTFRDGLIGDIFTSSVRSLQDLSYSFFYLLSGLNPNVSIIDNESSTWILYTFVLPACTVSPLWWRFLQNLRQAYDYRKRWPYLGNAFKYFIAAEVALFGLFVPTNKDSFIWISCFVIATLYQIWWDTFMDWELFDAFQLRKTRLYKYKSMYYFIFGINVLLRFCWTLSFIPPHTLSRAGLLIPTFSNDADLLFKNIINPALASAEIIRRTLWTLLRVELQAIKTMNESSHKITKEEDTLDDLKEMLPMSIESDASNGMYSSTQPFSIFQTSLAVNTEVQVLTELALWATAFASLGIIAAAHRE